MIVHTLVFSLGFLKLFLLFVGLLPCFFGDKIVLKVIMDKYVVLDFCSKSIYFLLDWLVRRDLIDIWFKLVWMKRSKYFLIGFPILSLLQFKHVTNNSPSELIFHSELEDKISQLLRSSAMLEMPTLLLSSESCICWKCCHTFSVFCLFSVLTIFLSLLSIRGCFLPFHLVWGALLEFLRSEIRFLSLYLWL